MSPQNDPTGASWLRYSHLGIQFCLTVLLGVALGYWGDSSLGTDPWLVIVGSLLGSAAATWLLLRDVARIGNG